MEEELRSSPAALLALEEALLDFCEARDHPGVLHFWESPACFVVLGYSRKMAEEVDFPQCQAAGVPVLRRSSGGGTVLQGPGCFNYTLVLPIDSAPEFASISSTNKEVMERHRGALERLLGEPVSVRGCTDLAVGNKKFCGNAQRRKRRCFLFHGSFLTGVDFSLMEIVLKLPPQQPEYRQGRTHREFLTNIPIAAERLQNALRSCWPEARLIATPPDLPADLLHIVHALLSSKYSRAEWNEKF